MKKKRDQITLAVIFFTTLHDLDSAGMVTISLPVSTLSLQQTEEPMHNWTKMPAAAIMRDRTLPRNSLRVVCAINSLRLAVEGRPCD